MMIRRMASCSGWRLLTSFNVNLRLASSTSPIASQELNASSVKTSVNGGEDPVQDKMVDGERKEEVKQKGTNDSKVLKKRGKGKSSLVADVFNSLQAKNLELKIDDKLRSANSVDDVLSATSLQDFSQYHALRALAILSEWTTCKKIEMKEYESDPRFIHLCKMITPKQTKNVKDNSNLGDLGVVLAITGEEQAARMVEGISFSQQIRVMSSLALKKRRSLHLLRALASNLHKSSNKFDLKQAADVLYAMAVLNFPDKNLLNKAVYDIPLCIHDNKKPAVIGSILTSIGILRFKNTVLLNMLSKWVESNIDACREQDLVALFLTLASVNYHPPNASTLYEILKHNLDISSLKPNVWLDVVWALSILNVVETSQLQSVLVPQFAERLTPTGYLTNIPAPARLKLLNINAVAQVVVKNYQGPLIADTSQFKFPIQRSQDKQNIVDSVIDSLTNLLPTSTYLRTDVDTGYGFLIDGECAIDAKCNPLPVEDSSPTSSAKRKRIAVLVCDYHDLCRESEELIGPVILQERILTHLGYTVMTVTHLEFKPKEKLVIRVQYLEQKLRKLAAL